MGTDGEVRPGKRSSGRRPQTQSDVVESAQQTQGGKHGPLMKAERGSDGGEHAALYLPTHAALSQVFLFAAACIVLLGVAVGGVEVGGVVVGGVEVGGVEVGV